MDFETIYQNYFREIYLYVRGLSSSDSIAEEIAQEAFFKALKSLDSFDGSKDIRAWLFAIARNTYFTYCRRQKLHPEQQLSETQPAQEAPMGEQLADEETAFRIHQFLHQMEEPYKEVFSLRVFGELPFEKIGLLFGKSPGWARVTFYRAKQKIAGYLESLEADSKGNQGI